MNLFLLNYSSGRLKKDGIALSFSSDSPFIQGSSRRSGLSHFYFLNFVAFDPFKYMLIVLKKTELGLKSSWIEDQFEILKILMQRLLSLDLTV